MYRPITLQGMGLQRKFLYLEEASVVLHPNIDFLRRGDDTFTQPKAKSSRRAKCFLRVYITEFCTQSCQQKETQNKVDNISPKYWRDLDKSGTTGKPCFRALQQGQVWSCVIKLEGIISRRGSTPRSAGAPVYSASVKSPMSFKM